MLRTALLINIYQKRVQALTSRLPLAQLLARAADNPALLVPERRGRPGARRLTGTVPGAGRAGMQPR
ncbi:hypothetical protein, partial [Bordetella pertussis]|uniref:hypothetical protein n=1 Tax=Bordetella pertussis TaxID=520 RepID=UPI001C9E803A